MNACETRWWHKEEDQVVCDLCPRTCRLHDGQRAFCFVRQNVGGQMTLTTYGKSTGFCIDPIEKKPLNHFLPGTPVLSFGTAGCNLGCKFCQNWDISKSREIERLSESASPESIAAAAIKSGCSSVAFTYNDPVIWAEYAIDTAIACHEVGLKTVAVTAGYIQPKAREDFYSVIDAANVDLKAFTELFYKHLCLSRLEPVLDTLRWLKHESDVWFEITNLVIPDENDSPEEIGRMCDWILDNVGDEVPVHFTAFHPDFRLLHRPHTPHETLSRAHEQATKAGLRFVYIGNVNDAHRSSTYCPSCRTLLIERDWYELGAYNMKGNRCGSCGAVIPGVFDKGRGDWGRKRRPIRIVDAPFHDRQFPERERPSTHDVAGSRTLTGCPTGPASSLVTLEFESAPQPRIQYSLAECDAIRDFVRSVVDHAVTRLPSPPLIDQELGASPAYGAFVTLERGSSLRACRGRWGGQKPLAEVLELAARDAAINDPRFPSIVPEELPFLQLDISLMFAPRRINARGAERTHEVEIGKHGLVIAHPDGRGLLLPQVATQAGWNAKTFLDHVCQKAMLPPLTWMQDAAELMTFEARVLHAPARSSELDMKQMPAEHIEQLADIVHRVLADAFGPDVAPDNEFGRPLECEAGVCLHTISGQYALVTETGRPLADIVASAARSLVRSAAVQARGVDPVDKIVFLWQPIPLSSADHPARHRLLTKSAIVVRGQNRWGFMIPPAQNSRDPIADAFAAAQLPIEQWIRGDGSVRVTAFHQHIHRVAPLSGARMKLDVRPAAKADQFYPSDPEAMRKTVDEFLATGKTNAKARCAAVMLPHAGWTYCGKVIGNTLARVDVPALVVVLCPNHTGRGARWSVSPADHWEIPGATVPIARQLRRRLLELAPEIQAEPEAHHSEHAVEVLIPFLHRLNPEIRLLPIVVGAHEYSQTDDAAAALATILRESDRPILLVISSDMNHFATEAENRRLDFMALDAMLTGDPQRLFDVVRRNQISMCGVVPAVTVLRALGAPASSLALELVDYSNSGIVTGDMRRVVGYAGMLIRLAG